MARTESTDAPVKTARKSRQRQQKKATSKASKATTHKISDSTTRRRVKDDQEKELMSKTECTESQPDQCFALVKNLVFRCKDRHKVQFIIEERCGVPVVTVHKQTTRRHLSDCGCSQNENGNNGLQQPPQQQDKEDHYEEQDTNAMEEKELTECKQQNGSSQDDDALLCCPIALGPALMRLFASSPACVSYDQLVELCEASSNLLSPMLLLLSSKDVIEVVNID